MRTIRCSFAVVSPHFLETCARCFAPEVHGCLSGGFDHILGFASYSVRAALERIGPGSFRPPPHSACHFVAQLTQGTTQSAGHNGFAIEPLLSIRLWVVVANDTKDGWAWALLSRLFVCRW